MLDDFSYGDRPKSDPIQHNVHFLNQRKYLVVVLLVRKEDALIGHLAAVVFGARNYQLIVFSQVAGDSIPIESPFDCSEQSPAFDIQPFDQSILKQQPVDDLGNVAY